MDRLLTERLGRPVEVAYGWARRTPVQVVYGPERVRVRLHRFFRAAPEQVREDLAAWLRAGKRARAACRRLDAWIDARLGELPEAPVRPVACRPCGRVYDLDEVAEPLYAAEFVLDYDGRSRPGLTWGRRGPSCARRSLQLGSYTPESRTVRIHPVLDQGWVPAWFVRYVLFHEILHDVLPSQRGAGGRVVHHSRVFRTRERGYADYGRALRWQRGHLGRLIRSAKRGW